MNRAKDENQNFADAILRIRQENGLSQEQLAERLGMTRQAVSRWEMGISTPNIATLIQISETFGISLDSMLKGTGDEVRTTGDISASSGSQERNGARGYLLLILGVLGMISLPFLAKWMQLRNMEVYQSAYTYSYAYILEYPVCIILVLSLLFLAGGTYHMFKDRRHPG